MEGKRSRSVRNLDTISSVTLLKHIENVPGVNCLIYYTGDAFTIFPLQVEDEDLSFISYLSSGFSKVWYVILASHKTRFESFVAAKIVNFKYPKEHCGGIRQIIATKIILFAPNIMTTIPFRVKVHKIIQRSNRFAILGPGICYGGFITRYNIAKATNFADFSWPEYGRVSAKYKKHEKRFMHLTLPVERVFWMEAHMNVEATKNQRMLSEAVPASRPYLRQFCKALSGSIGAIVLKR